MESEEIREVGGNGFSARFVLGSFVAGAVLGLGVAVLYAPMPGRQVRERMREAARGMKDGSVDYVRNRKSQIRSAIEAGKEAYHKEKEKHAVRE